MDPVKNPFAPGAGVQPPELRGREVLLSQASITLNRIKEARSAKSFIAVGLRGVGKTVLLNRVQQDAHQTGYRTSLIEAHENKPLPLLLVPELRRLLLELDRLGALSEHVKHALGVLKSFVGGLRVRYGEVDLQLDIDGQTGQADSGDLEADLPQLFTSIGMAARARNQAVALFIDEIQYLTERDMSALIMALHRIAQTNLPVVLMAAGLPQTVGLTGRSKSYAERLFDFPPIDALDHADAAAALSVPVQSQAASWAPQALNLVVTETKGYPYFLQEWGYQAWNTAKCNRIDLSDARRAGTLARGRLDESFFRVRFDRTTPREKIYLRAMAELGSGSHRSGSHRSGEIADLLGVKVQSVGPLRNGLIAKGMIYSPNHGDTAFTVPLFDEYLKRVMPDWHPKDRD